MADWADEKADLLMDALWDEDSNIQAGLAVAFRQFWAETLEEAAVVIENDCHDDMTRAEEAAAIRALKDKP